MEKDVAEPRIFTANQMVFDSDEMFTDYGIEIDIDESGAFCRADIVG